MKSKLYLACPYTHPDQRVIRYRVEEATAAAGILISSGYNVYSPLTHCYPIAVMAELPEGFQYWQEHNFSMIEWADIFCVLTMKGWEYSEGVKKEQEYAESLGKSIMSYIHITEEEDE